MAITPEEWDSIYAAIGRAQQSSTIVQGRILKVNAENKTIFLQEFGSQPIPLFAFEYEIKYYDVNSTGQTLVKKATTTVKMPQVGEIALVLRQHGTRRLPKCIGILRSRNFTEPGDN